MIKPTRLADGQNKKSDAYRAITNFWWILALELRLVTDQPSSITMQFAVRLEFVTSFLGSKLFTVALEKLLLLALRWIVGQHWQFDQIDRCVLYQVPLRSLCTGKLDTFGVLVHFDVQRPWQILLLD